MERPICKFNQVGFCKFGEECGKFHENEKCLKTNCNPKKCTKKHPKECRYFSVSRFCKFGSDCAFLHGEKVVKEDVELWIEEVNTLKVEIDVLKNKVKSISSITQEETILMESIKVLKEEIEIIKDHDKETEERLKVIENCLEDVSEDDSEMSENLEDLKIIRNVKTFSSAMNVLFHLRVK